MKSILLLLCLLSFAFVDSCAAYSHKSEAEIARMSPAGRVDEWVNEKVHHRYDLSDKHAATIRTYLLRDGLKSLPRAIEIMNEYDPTRFPEGQGRRGERFDAAAMLVSHIDELAVRVRGSDEGRKAMDALERAINRMRAAGYGREDQQEWAQHGRIEVALSYLQAARGINDTDYAIKHTLRYEHRIQISDTELLELSNFLVARYPEYPSWSERDFIRIEEAGKPMPG
ncbi:MAG: hypothetical protein M3539_08885, partial [Acidobacteriota bacterium]|nr:hypothetical protein [Acidobacteriota bacterium]